MALQLVYTSAPKLLDAGRSGFGVVARSKNLPPLAANAIERFSKFANMQGTDRSRIVMAHRKVMIGNTRLHVLSRIRDSGSDHTGRTNHIAHHLIFSPLEIRQAAAQRLTPADVFAQFAWLDRWEGAPKAFDGSADVQIGNFIPQFAATQRAAWVAATGEPLHSRLLAWDGAPKSGALILPDGIEIHEILGEALAECQNSWEKTFTTSLEPTDELAELDWVIAYRSDSSAISRVSSRTVFDLTRPHDLPVPPEAVQPMPDVRSASSQQETPPITQEPVIPSPGYTLRPVYAPTIPATRSEPAKSRPTAVTNTRGTGNGKLWAIIGGGIAALFLLIVTAFFLINASNTNRLQAEEETRKKEKREKSINHLVTRGELKDGAEKILDLGFDSSALLRLPDEITKLKDSINELGALTTDNTSIDSKMEKFANATASISDLNNLPRGSLCHSLWDSLKIIRNLRTGDTTSKKPIESLGDLKSSLQSGATLTDPEWIKQDGIDRIYSILWEWKYISLVGDLVDGKNSATAEDVESFVMGRLPEIVTVEKLKAINEELDEIKRKNYVNKLRTEKPELLSILHLAPTQPQPKKDPAPIAHKPEKPANQPVQIKLEDEEWHVANYERGTDGFSIEIPKSKILTLISKEKQLQKVKFAFGDEEMTTLNNFGSDKNLQLDGNRISCSTESRAILTPSPLKIIYEETELIVHLGTMPKIQEPINLNGRFERIPGKSGATSSYKLIINGSDLNKIEGIISKIIPNPTINFTTKLENKLQAFTYLNGELIFIEGIKPGNGDFDKPSPDISKQLKDIIKDTIIKNKEGKEKPDPDEKESEEAWYENGSKKLRNDRSYDDANKWIEKAIRIKMGDSYRLKDVKKIQGENLSDLEKFVANTLRDPIENHIPPEKINTIQAIISVDDKKIMDANVKITYK